MRWQLARGDLRYEERLARQGDPHGRLRWQPSTFWGGPRDSCPNASCAPAEEDCLVASGDGDAESSKFPQHVWTPRVAQGGSLKRRLRRSPPRLVPIRPPVVLKPAVPASLVNNMGLLCIATIFSTFVQAMLYGAFLGMSFSFWALIRSLSGFAVLMFILTMWILLGTHRRRKPNVVMVASSCTVMLLATLVRLQ